MQLHHQGGEREVAGERMGDEPPDRVRLVGDVGVGQEQIVRRVPRLACPDDALADRPQFAGPALRQRGGGKDRQGMLRLGKTFDRPRRIRGCVLAVVVDEDDAELSRVVLAQQRGEGVGKHVGFVARRDDGDDARPSGRLR